MRHHERVTLSLCKSLNTPRDVRSQDTNGVGASIRCGEADLLDVIDAVPISTRSGDAGVVEDVSDKGVGAIEDSEVEIVDESRSGIQ